MEPEVIAAIIALSGVVLSVGISFIVSLWTRRYNYNQLFAETVPDYTFIFKSQTTINFDIKLNNPKNYYIMDFKLTCDEEQIEYYDKEMEKWTPINDIWIRWSGSNNQESRYRLRLPNPEISPDKIKISEMYYSDRTDGTNKTAVNMNNKETYTVYTRSYTRFGGY